MASRIRRLPGLRRLSNFQAGGYLAAGSVVLVSLLLSVTETKFFRHPPSELLVALVGLGGAVFVAYSIAMSSLFRELRRGSETEYFIGFLVGLGFCGIAGVGMALVLLEVSRPFGWLAHLALFWAGFSLFLLAVLVAALPLFVYERAAARHVNHDDE